MVQGLEITIEKHEKQGFVVEGEDQLVVLSRTISTDATPDNPVLFLRTQMWWNFCREKTFYTEKKHVWGAAYCILHTQQNLTHSQSCMCPHKPQFKLTLCMVDSARYADPRLARLASLGSADVYLAESAGPAIHFSVKRRGKAFYIEGNSPAQRCQQP